MKYTDADQFLSSAEAIVREINTLKDYAARMTKRGRNIQTNKYGYSVTLYNSGKPRSWGVYTPQNELICVCLYKKGAISLLEHIERIISDLVAT